MHTPGLKKESGKCDEIAKFLEHATLLRGIEHPNIQSVLCVSVEDNCVPLVVYPMVEYGNMHDVLLSCRLSPDQSPLNVSEGERGREGGGKGGVGGCRWMGGGERRREK